MDKYFLASNGSEGFHGIFQELTTYKEIEKLYIIKAGAGCGKSTFMKRVANYLLDNGFDIEFIHCSSDASSLDGIISRTAKLAMCDGTPPHAVDAKYLGAFETYLDFGRFLDEELLKENREQIESLTNTISNHYKTVYSYIKIAGQNSDKLFSMAISSDVIEEVKTIAQNILATEIPVRKSEKIIYERYITGIAPQGMVNFKETLLNKAKIVITLKDTYGLSTFFLSEILNKAQGYTIYKFACPINKNKIDHLYIEELGLLFMSTTAYLEIDGDIEIDLDKFAIVDDENKVSFLKCQISENLEKAVFEMLICKSLHDDLEDIYIEAMDFPKLDEYFYKIIDNIKKPS